jgi:hypothetical protein
VLSSYSANMWWCQNLRAGCLVLPVSPWTLQGASGREEGLKLGSQEVQGLFQGCCSLIGVSWHVLSFSSGSSITI